MEQISKKIDLKLSQIYKWNWDRRMAHEKYSNELLYNSS
jgi:hypothetical protein